MSTRGYLRSTASESVALTEYGSNCIYLDVTGRETILIFATSGYILIKDSSNTGEVSRGYLHVSSHF